MMPKIAYEKRLNPNQLAAVVSPDGPTLIIAGAGSGKTRTLVYRVAWLVENGIPPEKILLLTFTRKAAQEMLQRVEAMLGQTCQGVAGGTFHALAYKILRIYGSRIGLPGPLSVIDRKDSEETIGKLLKSLGLGKNKDFPDRRECLELHSRIINRGTPFEEGVGIFYPHWEPFLPQLKALEEAYETFKRQHFLLDYDDLLRFTLTLFTEVPEVAETCSASYRYVLVDEYQDTNLLQAEMVRFLVQTHGNLMVVGDDSQSIYGFRGAHFKNIMDFPRSFPQSRLITLEENYRSSQPILNLANTLISFSNERYSKCLFSRSPQGLPPVCVELPYEESQSQFVVQQLQKLNREGLAWQEMAVLFRAGHHSFNLEIALQKQGIPFVKVGGRRLVEGSHIKDFLSYLKVIANPQDVLAWERILRLLEGLGPKRAQDLIGLLKTGTDWSQRLSSLEHYPRLRSQIEPLESLLKELTGQTLQPTQALELIWEYYRELLPRIYEEDYQRRQKEIEEIIRVSLNYSDLEAFLGDLALEAYEGEKTREGGRLTLSTVHSAKGLEWKAVFIIWLTEGRFPSIHALETAEETEEERRLLYVAVTRAKERLFLTYPQALSPRAGGWQHQEICRFLTAIPKEILPRLGEPTSSQPSKKEVYPSSDPDNGFPVGMRVFHPLFGTGVIQEAPRERKVRVLFKRYGSKVLHLDFAPLEKGEAPDARPAL